MNGKQKEDYLVLIDGTAYLYRAYHALPPLKNTKGENTGAIHGFLKAITSASSHEYSAAVSISTFANGICFAPFPAISS